MRTVQEILDGQDVKSLTGVVTATETTRVTAITPTSGKRVKILAVMMAGVVAGLNGGECYFGTGANIDSTAAKAIGRGGFNETGDNLVVAWAVGQGPLGAVDEVVSVRAVGLFDYNWAITYREE